MNIGKHRSWSCNEPLHSNLQSHLSLVMRYTRTCHWATLNELVFQQLILQMFMGTIVLFIWWFPDYLSLPMAVDVCVPICLSVCLLAISLKLLVIWVVNMIPLGTMVPGRSLESSFKLCVPIFLCVLLQSNLWMRIPFFCRFQTTTVWTFGYNLLNNPPPSPVK